MSIPSTPTWCVTPHPGYQINSTAISADGQRCVLGTSSEYASGDFAVYGYNGNGQSLWCDPLGETTYQGVFWVSMSADGRYAAAAGTCTQNGRVGFLRAYDADSGRRLLDQTFAERVNQVALSDDGEVLVAVSGAAISAYRLGPALDYRLCATASLPGAYCRSCAISGDGQRLVVGASVDTETVVPSRHNDAGSDSSGYVAVFDLSGDRLQLQARTSVDCAIMYVDLLADGQWWAASRHDGGLMAFNAASSLPDGKPLWTFTPPGQPLSVAYGVALARRDDADIQFACGANLTGSDDGHGLLYVVTCSPQGGAPQPLWQYFLHHDPNPGIGMDRQARYICATDGQPAVNGQESAGDFYLFEGANGTLRWCYPTSLMNWPMQVDANGTAAFGASDNGSAYYWQLE
ncbi:WD40 repeat domain-containing protein [Kushneria aurantia]|uniref:WD40 repeat domain-containing protein n=1 Tax=Kushneria aurantia TaxID=504092 RepID=A0ABV6G7K8_9GAMM|nr:hypothetical protein [Kushneria aurantia]